MQLGLHGEEKSIENWHNIRNGHSENDLFDTSKPRNFNSLRGKFYYETVTLKLDEEENQCQNKVLWLFFTSFR